MSLCAAVRGGKREARRDGSCAEEWTRGEGGSGEHGRVRRQCARAARTTGEGHAAHEQHEQKAEESERRATREQQEQQRGGCMHSDSTIVLDSFPLSLPRDAAVKFLCVRRLTSAMRRACGGVTREQRAERAQRSRAEQRVRRQQGAVLVGCSMIPCAELIVECVTAPEWSCSGSGGDGERRAKGATTADAQATRCESTIASSATEKSRAASQRRHVQLLASSRPRGHRASRAKRPS